MQRLNRKEEEHVFVISCFLTNLKDKKSEVIAAVCALLNSNGGKLALDFPSQKCEKKDLDQTGRKIEQWIKNLIGTVKMKRKVKLEISADQMLLTVKGSNRLITVNYHMYLPSHTEVNQVSPIETLEEIRKCLFGDKEMIAINELPTVRQVFVQGEEMKLIETYSVQFKQLEDTPTKSTTLGDRVVANCKLVQYISAFANHCGGAIYVGVDDKQHRINGEVISANERKSIITKVTKKVENMIWLELQDGPCKGVHWDINFYPVVDKSGRSVTSTFVIVVTVARCPGGVFTEAPESYHCINGSIEEMPLSTWKDYLSERTPDVTDDPQRIEPTNGVSTNTGSTSVVSTIGRSGPLHIGRLHWSSVHSRKSSAKMNGILIRKINDGLYDEFQALVMKEQANCPEGEMSLVILSMKITANYKQGKFKDVQSDMEEYEKELSKSKDWMIGKAREFLLKSSIQRCDGRVQESYEEAKNGLATVEQIPAGIVVCNFYTNIATVITIILEQENDMEIKKSLKKDSIMFFQKALEHAHIANDYLPSKFDNIQKVNINLAFLHLNGSFANRAREGKVEKAAIDTATNNLNAVDRCINEGYSLSDYRSCQYLLARSLLFYRRSQNLVAEENDRRSQMLKSALKFSTEAKEKATQCNLFEMIHCTSRHIDFYQGLVKYAVFT
ncbi:uncharacterized protein LOC114526274 [Dendronephthya gigantea]|uniref:uncharacterized protein LOC114526274 n=1 Tax=Dendronephthya gigantea TaxID=151771 RepID=UPI001069BF3C|nr:uncharacterized protein LOC114526274 [Dendronephthya gigantea]